MLILIKDRMNTVHNEPQVFKLQPATPSVVVPPHERKILGISANKVQDFKTGVMDMIWLYSSLLVINPLDRLKTIRQTSTTLQSHGLPVKQSALDNLRTLVKREKVHKALFKGTNATFLSTLGRIGVQQEFYQGLRNFYFAEGEYIYTVRRIAY